MRGIRGENTTHRTASELTLRKETKMPIQTHQIEKAVEILQQYGVKRLILFGSAKDRPTQARDLDLACDGIEGWHLFEAGAQLEEELRVPIDLVPLSPSTQFTRYIEKYGKVLL